jgi:hypothetical protein
VGIGVTNPQTQLGNTATNNLGTDGAGTSANSINWANNAPGYTETLYNAGSAANADGLAIKVNSTNAATRLLDLSTSSTQLNIGTTVMAVFGNGRVGIGTTTPGAITEIWAGATDILKITSNFGGTGNHAYIDFLTYAGTGAGVNARIGAIDAGNENGSLVFETNNNSVANSATTTERMRILNTGYVGIGITTPGYPLQVSGSVNLTGSNTFGRLSSTQNDVNVTGGYSINPTIYASADIVAGGGFYAFSDRRIKKDVEPITGAKALEQIMQVQPVSYGYIDTLYRPNHRTLGFIAQEVEKVIPEAVSRVVDYLPNVLAEAEICKEGSQTILDFSTAKNIDANAELKAYAQSGTQTNYVVTGKVNNSVYILSGDNAAAKVFVFGSKVNDFRSVDYDKVFVVGISAIQQLAQKVEQLEKKNAELNDKLTAVSSDSNDIQLLQKQLTDLKLLMEKNGIRSER